MISVKKHIVVETSQQRAFRTFTAGMDRWWPREHHIGGSPLERMIVEPLAGGRWYSICQDGSEIDVGKVISWEPPGRLVLAWQITADWKYDPAFSTEIEVTFIAEGPRRTVVELEHKQLERYGAAADAVKKQFESDDAWAASLAAFGRAVKEPKYVLTYESSAAGLAKAPDHFAGHVAWLGRYQARGTLLMIGPLVEPVGRAMSIFTTRAAAEAFAREDPFVVHGVVERWSIAEWKEALY